MTTTAPTGAPEAGAGMYEGLLRDLLATGAMRRDDTVLVQFAGAFDRDVAARLGLERATFVNLAPDSPSARLDDAVQGDAHRMDLPDGGFDHVVGHAGLHHCSRPHQALHEMYRIARGTVVAVENQDSVLMRVAQRAGLAGTYEFDAVADGGGTTGGVDGTGVPNHVYRWTRREVLKTVRTFDPGREVPVEFHAHWLVGPERALTPGMRAVLGERGAAPRGVRAWAGTALNRGLNTLARGQGNIFGFVIRKDLARPHPWI
ncbi:methyltransferase domain-containing protein [Actinomycetospora sp. TBRC 11914]|uniref:class I SAM-dependent methyltransferase n=1 Tax=Actinomycetospora sp. TBRC 11914 TaxID=2729387 RepID=UPI00145C72D9|nr:methyltransferase domain-containing protein [Actinomycetospora sp. TBRC 11914]NMO90383.1 class I SAM-dependent methyltransferase [Actinomycetospora sp. TBRC 11914]